MNDEKLYRECAELDGACVHDWVPSGGMSWKCRKCPSAIKYSCYKPREVDKYYLYNDEEANLAAKLGMLDHLEVKQQGFMIVATILPSYFPDGSTAQGQAPIGDDGPNLARSRAILCAIIMAAGMKKKSAKKEAHHRGTEDTEPK